MTTTSRKRRNSPRSASGVGAITNFLRGKRDIRLALSSARLEFPVTQYGQLFAAIANNPFYRPLLSVPGFPGDVGTLHRLPLLDSITPDGELVWTSMLLAYHAEPLRAFVRLRGDFERALLREDTTQCFLLLAEIERATGVSLWLIKTTLALLSLKADYEDQKSYVSLIRRGAPVSVAALIAHQVSIRNEQSTSLAGFLAGLQRSLSAQPPDVAQYVYHHLSPNPRLPVSRLADLLRFDSLGSAVDLYESFLFTARASAARGADRFRDTLSATLRRVEKAIPDRRTVFLRHIIGGDPLPPAAGDALATDICREYAAKNTHAALHGVGTLLRTHADHPDAWQLAAKILTRYGGDLPVDTSPLQRKIVDGYVSLYRLDGKSSDVSGELAKFEAVWSTLPCVAAVTAFRLRALADDLVSDTVESRFSALGISTLTPLRLSTLPSHAQSAFYRAMVQAYGVKLPWFGGAVSDPLLFATLDDAPSGPDQPVKAAFLALAQSDGTRAASAAEALQASDERATYVIGTRLRFAALLMLGDISAASQLAVSVCMADSQLAAIVPIADIAARVSRDLDAVAGNLATPVLLDLYTRQNDDHLNGARNFSYEALLTAHGVQRPSSLASLPVTFELPQLIYFLRNVCVESVMDTSIEFVNSRDVVEERVSVCRRLLELDPERQDAYNAEIKTLLRRLTVRPRLLQIEQSKVHVDVDNVRVAALDKVRESFQRYSLLRDIDTDEELLALVRTAINRVNAEGSVLGRSLSLIVPINERDDLFRAMVATVRDEFVANTEHGLDGYLSVRIRHGTLAGQLRAPLEATRLITARDENDEYIANDYWLSRGGVLTTAQTRLLTAAFDRLSQGIDDVINTIRGEWVQVRRDVDAKGLFDLVLTPIRLHRLLATAGKADDVEGFVTAVMRDLLIYVEDSLAVIRQRLANEAKLRATDLLNALDDEVTQLGGGAEVSSLADEIRQARLETQRAFDRVVQWFNLSRTSATDPFVFSEAITIALEIVQADHWLELQQACSCDVPLRGEHLNSVVDILIILLQNVQRHTGHGTARGTLSVTANAKVFIIEMTNATGDSASSSAARTKVAEIMKSIRLGQGRTFVSKEGGSGFHKIAKILASDLRVTPPPISCGFDRDNFWVRIEIPQPVIQL